MATAHSEHACLPHPRRSHCSLHQCPRSSDDDRGQNHICIKMWSNGVGNGANFCEQTGQDSDWCQEKKPCHEDESQECGIMNWCVNQWAWGKYIEKVGCDNAVDLHCDAVNQKALEACAAASSRIAAPANPSAPLPSSLPHVLKCVICRGTDESSPSEHQVPLECLRTRCRSGASLLNDKMAKSARARARTNRMRASMLVNTTAMSGGRSRQHVLGAHQNA